MWSAWAEHARLPGGRKKLVCADSGLTVRLREINHSVPTTVIGQEERDMSVAGRLFGEGRNGVLDTSLIHMANKIHSQSHPPAQTVILKHNQADMKRNTVKVT